MVWNVAHAWQAVSHAAGRLFNYDAVDPRGRRKAPTVSVQAEDDVLNPSKRAKLLANTRDLHRNYSILAWMVRAHLNYVTEFNFHARTENEDFNTTLETYVAQHSAANACDIRGRHTLDGFIRLAELRCLIDGDVAILRTDSEHLQAIEGDRIRDPEKKGKSDKWVQGAKLDTSGRPISYGIYSRASSGFVFEREVTAEHCYLLGYFDRFDQVRGITPLSAATNSMRDVYENIEQALLKCKVHNQFGIKFKRAGSEPLGEIGSQVGSESEDAEEPKGYSVDFGAGPFVLDLEPGDDAELMMSNHPPNEFQDFMRNVIMVTLRALDLPYSFFDESHTNFFGSRGAWLHYERSCRFKRDRIAELLNWITDFWLRAAVLSGRVALPKGMLYEQIKWDWVPCGMPWWKPSEEINGDVQAIAAGLTCPQRVTRERGTGDVFDNIRQTAKVLEFAKTMGVPLSFALAPVTNIEVNPSGK